MFRRFTRARRASAAVEFAIVGPLLLLLATGIYDYGTAMWQKMQVANAARVGAAYVTTTGWNAAAVTLAVQGATGLAGITASPAPTQACGCPDAARGIVAAACGSACASGDLASNYVTVHATKTYTFATPIPGRAGTATLRSTAVARVQ